MQSNISRSLPKIICARSDILGEQIAFGLFVATIAWSPFPLGSNRPWSWSLLALLIASAWFFWFCSLWCRPGAAPPLAYGYRAPISLALLAILWGVIQVLPAVPSDWVSPVWRSAGALLGGKLAATISVSPWRSTTELMKLVSYIMVAWLARVFARSPDGAYKLLDAIIIVGALYAAYGFILLLVGHSQFEIFYGMPLRETGFSGPFVNRNSFATYEGLVAVCAGGRLIAQTWSQAEFAPGIWGRLLSMGHYLAGKGAIWLLATLLAFSAVVMSGSRAGNFATWSAMVVLLLIALGLAKRQKRGWLALGVAVCTIAVVFALLAVNGTTLAGRLDDMVATGDTTRLLLWDAAWKMIENAPLTGWGLGTYQLVYPLYTAGSLRFIMDKAHNDFLEFAAGFGLPAAILWWFALAWLVALCARGIFVRKRYRVLPMVTLGASILVAIHSIFDFSLQMPAIALTYAVILGLGAAQAFPTSHSAGLGRA